MRPRALVRLIYTGIDLAGMRAPALLAGFARLSLLNRTSRQRIIRRVPERTGNKDKAAPEHTGTVIIPVYNNYDDTAALLGGFERGVGWPGALIVVDDCSTDRRIAPLLTAFSARNNNVKLLTNATNQGFVASCNKAFIESRGDVLILNTDTILPAGAIARLFAHLRSGPGVATATPFSNSAYGVGLPDLVYANKLPFGASASELDAALDSLAPLSRIELATGIGFCMAISRRALDKLDGFDPAFGAGYGEETDFCQRAASLGMKHVLASDVFVEHKGGMSFGGNWQDRSRAGLLRVLARHPGYPARVQAYLEDSEARAVSLAALICLAENKAGLKAIVSEGLSNSNETAAPRLHLEREARKPTAQVEWGGERYRFAFANRSLLDSALSLAGKTDVGAAPTQF